MIEHTCYPPNFCFCSVQALEPDDDCPIHGFPKRVDNCMVCGRFVSRPRPNIQEEEGDEDESI